MRNLKAISLGAVLAVVASAAPVYGQSGAKLALPAGRHADAAPSGAAVAASRSAFWRVLNDTILDRLMDAALSDNLELRAASARESGAGAARAQAALALAPVVTAGAGYTRRRLSSNSFPGLGAGALPDQDLWDSGLGASWELDLFGRLRGDLRARNALLGSAGDDVRDARVSLAAEVAGAYFGLRGAQGQLAVARRNADNQRHTLELTQARLDAGRGTAFDVDRARAQLSSTLAAVPALEAHIAVAQHRIAVLLGLSPGELSAELAPEAALPEFPDSVPALDPVDVVRTRPDVRAAEGQFEAARSLVSSARADYLPRLSIAATAGYTANAIGAFGKEGSFNYTVGPVISWAAFDLGHVKARVDEAQAQELEARAHYEQSVLAARAELADAAVQYRAARARLADLREAAAASERAASLARLRYEGGITDFLQVLDAERTLLTAQDQLAQAQTEVADAYVALSRAAGAEWPREAPEIH